MNDFRGIFPAVVTPFDNRGRLDVRTFERLLGRLYDAGVHGLYLCGSTGEGLLQSVAQRKTVAEAAILNSPPDKKVIVHVGAIAASDALELGRHASSSGAYAISSLPPIGDYSAGDVRGYYESLAGTVDVPVLLYYYPQLSAGIGGVDGILELGEIPNIAGVKFTDFDLYSLALIRQRGLAVLNGKDEVLVAGLLMGAHGGIGTFYNVVPEWFVEIFDLAQKGQWDQARKVQQRVVDLVRAVTKFPVFPAVKKILDWSGLDCGECLRPRKPLSQDQAMQLHAELERLQEDGGMDSLLTSPAIPGDDVAASVRD